MAKSHLFVTVALVVIILLSVSFQNCSSPMTTKPRVVDSTSSSSSDARDDNENFTPGPLDGSYSLGSWTCGEQNIFIKAQEKKGMQSLGLDIKGTKANHLTLFYSRCQKNVTSWLSFSAPGLISSVLGETTCSGCTSLECYPLSVTYPQQAQNFTYSSSPSALTLTRVLSTIDVIDPGAPYSLATCQSGEIETRIYLRR